MATCTTCGNDYEHTFTVTLHDGRSGTFDAFECAIATMAPRCSHCSTTILGHGVTVGSEVFCCSHCARAATGAHLADSVDG